MRVERPRRKKGTTLESIQAQAQWEREQEKLPGVFIPIRVNNPLNGRKHWRVVWQASKRSRTATYQNCCGHIPVRLPAVVTLTRYSPKEMDDDNLAAALKPVRDGVADVFGTNDAKKSGLLFIPRQEIAPFFGVRVLIEPTTPAQAGKE